MDKDIIIWNDNWSVNVKKFDDDHKELFELINELHNVVFFRNNYEEVKKLLYKFFKYSVHHFEAEEKLMREKKFPGYLNHKMEHDMLKKKIDIFDDELKTQVIFSTAKELLFFTKRWIIKHIGETDKKYTKFFNNLGIY